MAKRKLPRTVFAVWYMKGAFHEVCKELENLQIDLQIAEPYSDPKVFAQSDEAYFPDLGKVTIEYVPFSFEINDDNRWKVTMEIDDPSLYATYGKDGYSLGPEVLDCATWDEKFEKGLCGEAADWGVR